MLRDNIGDLHKPNTNLWHATVATSEVSVFSLALWRQEIEPIMRLSLTMSFKGLLQANLILQLSYIVVITIRALIGE